MTIQEKVQALGLDWPDVPAPVGNYVRTVRTGNLIFTAGQLPMASGQLLAEGKVPDDVAIEAAQIAARHACLNAIAAAAAEAGSPENIARIVRINVYVNSSPGFTSQSRVADGASDLLAELFKGGHTRCAVGAAELPLNSVIELDMIAELGE